MSAILSVDDLNDFITPGVACIKPVETLPPTPPSTTDGSEFEVIREGAPGSGSANAGPAQISLTDCLACSGCVTSAEAVLVSLQSHAEVLRTLDIAPGLGVRSDHSSQFSVVEAETPADSSADIAATDFSAAANTPADSSPSPLLYVASVAPQTRANLAAACGPGVTERQAGHMLDHLLAGPTGLRAGGRFNNGFTYVVDTNAAREATLVLGADEVIKRGQPAAGTQDGLDIQAKPAAQPSPLLTSSCPGWVCYAEKTHPHLLSHLSRVKSPQALTGTLLKTTLSRTLGISPDRIWHVAVMPCFDKKLEASREELTDSAWTEPKEKKSCDGTCGKHNHDKDDAQREKKDAHEKHDKHESHSGGCGSDAKKVRDVDCVITSKEILMLCASRGIDFFSLPKTPLWDSSSGSGNTRLPFPDPVLDKFLFPARHYRRAAPTPAAGTSGGNLHFVLQSVIAQNPGSTLQTTRGRNVDVVEYAVTVPPKDGSGSDATVLFKAARYYGFRNIQNLVRRLKPARPSRLPGGRAVGAGGGARRPVGKMGGKAGGGKAMSARAGAAGGAGAGLDFAYVEVMACPGGCTNGGGQVKVDDPLVLERQQQPEGVAVKMGPQEQKQWLAQIDEAYYSSDESSERGGDHNDDDDDDDDDDIDRMDVDGEESSSSDLVDGISPSYVRATLAHWAESTGFNLQRLAYTSYREVVSDIGKSGAGGANGAAGAGEMTTERVVQLAGKIGGGW